MRSKLVIYKVAQFTGDHKYPRVYCVLSNRRQLRNRSAPKRFAAAIEAFLSPINYLTLHYALKVQLLGHGTSLRHLTFGRKLAKFVRYLMTRLSRQPAATAITS